MNQEIDIQQEIVILAFLLGPRAMQILAAIKEIKRLEELRKAFGSNDSPTA